MWTLTEAQEKLSDIADLALNGSPQEITLGSNESVVLIRKADLNQLMQGGVASFFERAPKLDALAEVFVALDRD